MKDATSAPLTRAEYKTGTFIADSRNFRVSIELYVGSPGYLSYNFTAIKVGASETSLANMVDSSFYVNSSCIDRQGYF